MPTESPVSYELRFDSLFYAGRAFVFPCDSHGNVDMDHLGSGQRSNYFYARTVIGREVFAPVVRRAAPLPAHA